MPQNWRYRLLKPAWHMWEKPNSGPLEEPIWASKHRAISLALQTLICICLPPLCTSSDNSRKQLYSQALGEIEKPGRSLPVFPPLLQFDSKDTTQSQSLPAFHGFHGSLWNQLWLPAGLNMEKLVCALMLPLGLQENAASLIGAQYARCQYMAVIYSMSNEQAQWRGLLSTIKPDGYKQWLEAINSVQH